MSSSAQAQTRPRRRALLARVALIIPLVIVLGCIMGPVIYAVALTARRAHPPPPPTMSTSTPPTFTFNSSTAGPTTTAPGSCHSDADCRIGQVCVSGFCTNSTTTSSATSPATTSSTAGTTTSTTRTTSSTSTRTTTTTPHMTTTSGLFATCQACSFNAQTGSCASEYAACLANTYNCPVLCYGTFQLNGNPPATCTNGFIPQWPPLRLGDFYPFPSCSFVGIVVVAAAASSKGGSSRTFASCWFVGPAAAAAAWSKCCS